MVIRAAAIVAMMLAAALSYPGTLASQQPVALDPKALVGEWQGRWDSAGYGDVVYLTIKSATAERVVGVVYFKGPARHHNRDIDVSGAVGADGQVTLVHPQGRLDLTLVGPNQLAGHGTGDRAARIELKKK